MNRIREIREKRGLSQKQLAALVGTSQQQVTRYENDNSDMKSSMLMRFADALDVSVSYLLGLRETVPTLEDDETMLLNAFRLLSPSDRQVVMDVACSLAGVGKNKDVETESA